MILAARLAISAAGPSLTVLTTIPYLENPIFAANPAFPSRASVPSPAFVCRPLWFGRLPPAAGLPFLPCIH